MIARLLRAVLAVLAAAVLGVGPGAGTATAACADTDPDAASTVEQVVGIGMALLVVAGLVALMVVTLRMSASTVPVLRTTGTRASAAPTGPASTGPGTPLDLRPGHLAVLHAGRAETDAVAATLLDLAARGFLTVEGRPGAGWTLVRSRPRPGPREPRLPYEATLLRAVFRTGSRVAVTDLPAALGRDLGRVRDQLLDDAAARGWFANDVVAAWRWWRRVDRTGWVLSLVAGLLAVVPILRPTPADALPVLGYLLAAVVTFVLRRFVARLAGRRLPRSAAGDAVLADTSGFRDGLAAARDERWRRTPRTDDLRSRSLPYAVALGLVQPWSDVFAGLRRSGFTWTVTEPAPGAGARG